MVIRLSDNVHAGDVVPELDVRHDAVDFSCMLDVPNHLRLFRPRAPLDGEAQLGVILAPVCSEPHVERCQVRLKPRRLVCLHQPSMPTSAVVLLVHDVIVITLVRVDERVLDAAVASADDDPRVRPHIWGRLEGLDSFHRQLLANLLVIVLHLPVGALLDHEFQIVRMNHGTRGYGVLDICYLRANLHRDRQALIAPEDRDLALSEAAAMELGIPARVEDVEAQCGHLLDLLLRRRPAAPQHARGRRLPRPHHRHGAAGGRGDTESRSHGLP
mmetsp:Transcript_47448/g.122610  ORF Transcript_47448/g.122610 Transcript_47448/m.122610 type:complete len:272 (+) Transcript_47448:1435-2250(+)